MEDQYSCSQCQYKVDNIEDMRIHERSHGILYSFGHIPEEIPTISPNQVQGKPKRYKCKICDFETDFIVYLKQHTCSCSDCKYVSHSNYKFKNHLCLKGASSSQVSTENTTRVSSVQGTLNKSSPGIFKCSMCSFQCKAKGILKLHSSVHAQVLFKCTLCHFTTCFENMFEFHKTSHEGIMTDEKEYKCSHCPFVTTNSNDVLLHCQRKHKIQTDIKDKNSKSYLVSQGNKESKSLTSSEEIDSRISKSSVYTCSLCLYKSEQKNSYGKHILTNHKRSVYAAIKNILGKDRLPTELKEKLTPENIVNFLNGISLPKLDYKLRIKKISNTKNTLWTLEDKKELYWCHIYSKCKLFSQYGFADRRRRMLEARGIMNPKKVRDAPEKRFHSMIANIKMGKTKITATEMKAIEKDVDNFIQVKLINKQSEKRE